MKAIVTWTETFPDMLFLLSLANFLHFVSPDFIPFKIALHQTFFSCGHLWNTAQSTAILWCVCCSWFLDCSVMDWRNCKWGRWSFIISGSLLEYPFNYYGIDFSGLGKLNWWSRCRRFLVKDWQGPNSCKCFQTFETLNNSTKYFKVAACFGAPLLNLLVGTGIGCTAAILSDPDRADGVLLDVSYKRRHTRK